MKTWLCVICIFVLSSLSGGIAECEGEISLTTEKDILFSGIPWEINVNEFHSCLESLEIEYKSTYTDYGDGSSMSIASTSFGDGEIIPIIRSDHVPTREYWIQPKNYYSFLCEVAGHHVDSMRVSYYRPYSSKYDFSTNGFRLYEIDIDISSHKLISATEQYADLKQKLTTLYGQPNCRSDESSIAISEYSVWTGANGSAVILVYYDFEDSDLESVSLRYGLASTSEVFQSIEQQKFAQNEQQKSDALDSIADDYSGL